MTAKILIVDDIKANLDLLEAKLVSNYYEVKSAMNGYDGIELAKTWHPDLLLLDVMMPGIDGFQVCEILKKDPMSMHVPIVMVTALNDRQSKLKGLSCGADDFLSKPIDDFALSTRIRSLLRLKLINDELRLRYSLIAQLDGELGRKLLESVSGDLAGAKVLLVEDDLVQAGRIRAALKEKGFEVVICKDIDSSFELIQNSVPDLVIIDFQVLDISGLKVCSQIRRQPQTRYVPIIMIVDQEMDGSQGLLDRGIEVGINDYLNVPLDGSELLARAILQIRHKYYQDALQTRMQDDVRMSVLDSLTGCYNRRYFDIHLKDKILEGESNKSSLCFAMIDLDNFKSVNDKYGHPDGDKVLKSTVEAIRENIRASDLLARYGGEEFAILFPRVEESEARAICERVRDKVENNEIKLSTDLVKRTVSIGLTQFKNGDTPASLTSRADEALYKAKGTGKNKVVCG